MRQAAWARLRVFLLAAALPAVGMSQEGFPLDGTWRGEWGPAGADGQHVVIVMSWDGERINGMINPGPRSLDFEQAQLEPGTWTVRIAAVDQDGRRIEIEGTLEDIGAYNRHIAGTWRLDGQTHEFRITRE